MMIDRKLKEELNALSREVFGASSRWVKLIENGYHKPVTETVTEFVPDEAHPEGGTNRQVEVPVKHKGIPLSRVERHTVESVHTLLLDLKAKRDTFLAEIEQRRQEEEAKKAQEKLQKEVNEQLMGSALT